VGNRDLVKQKGLPRRSSPLTIRAKPNRRGTVPQASTIPEGYYSPNTARYGSYGLAGVGPP